MADIKASNPKDAIGSRKVGLSRVSMPVVMEMDVATFEGALKYGRHNYRAIGVRTSVYFDAALRHLFAFWEGQDLDPDSGLHHVTKALASLAVLRDAQMQGKVDDDRPPVSNPDFIADLNKKVAALIEKYPDPVEPWTQTRVAESEEAHWVIKRGRIDEAYKELGKAARKNLTDVEKAAAGKRSGCVDRRVTTSFDSNVPMRRQAHRHEKGGSYWGRRVTDPVAY